MRARLSIGFVTIGFTPRNDIVPELVEELRAGKSCPEPDVHEYGALDGLADDELPAVLAGAGEASFVTRGRRGEELVLSAARVEERLDAMLRGIDDRGHDLIVLLCTGTTVPQLRNTLVLEAQKIVDNSIEAMIGAGCRLGVLLPLERQIDDFQLRHRYSAPVRFAAFSPYASGQARPSVEVLDGCDATVMHCMGYSRDMRDALRHSLPHPVLHARGIVGGLLRQFA